MLGSLGATRPRLSTRACLLLSATKVETTGPIDPTVLALKSDAELRDLLTALRQKECDERVNVNFAPYRSQRAIAETRLINVQNKIRQIEAEFDHRRCATLPAPTLSTRIVQQFSEPCYSMRLEDPRRLYSSLPPDTSPDPFAAKPRSPKRLLLKRPCSTGNPDTGSQATPPKTHDTSVGKSSTDDDGGRSATERSTATDRSSTRICVCDKTTSEESVGEAKKKLRGKVDETTVGRDRDVEEEMRGGVSAAGLTSGVCTNIVAQRCRAASAWKQERMSHERTPYVGDAERWVTKAYINVANYRSPETLTESVTIEKIDARDVCKSSDAIATRSSDRVTDREESGSPADPRRFEKQAAVGITISRKEMEEAIEEDDVPPESTQSPSPTTAQEDVTAAEIVDDDRIPSAQETEQVSPVDMCTSSLQITLKRKKKEYKDGQRDEDLPSLATEVIEQSANEPSINGSQKKINSRIVSFLTNIMYDKDREYQIKRKIDEEIATSGKGTNIVQPDIEKLREYSSMDNFPRHTIARDITERDDVKNAFSERPAFPKLSVDRPCQTASDVTKEDNRRSVTLLRANIFPPLKHLRKSVAGDSSIYLGLNYLRGKIRKCFLPIVTALPWLQRQKTIKINDFFSLFL